MQHKFRRTEPVVILCSPPCPKRFRFGEYLGLYYIDAYLRSRGVSTVLLGGTNSTTEEIAESITELNPLFVGITLSSHYLAESVSKLASDIKERIDTKVVVGGHFMCFRGEEFLRYANSVDIVVTHEGELVSWELVKCLDLKTDIQCVHGIVYRTSNGKIRSNKPRKLLEPLNCLPFPTRPKDIPAFSMVTSRGCYAKCSFCSVRAYARRTGGKIWRRRSVENVLLELEQLCCSKRAKAVSFVDDAFLGPGKDRRYAIDLALGIRRRCPGLGWAIASRTPDVDFETLSILKKNGLCNIGLGLESASDRALRRMNKGATREDNKRALQIAKELKLSVLPYFIFFDAETELRDIEENLRFLRDYDLARPSVLKSRIIPYPGTEIYNTYKRDGFLKECTFSYDVKFRDQVIDVISQAFEDVFSSVLKIEHEVQRQEFAADLLALHGRVDMKKTIKSIWIQLSNICIDMAYEIYETVQNQMTVSPKLLVRWKEVLGKECAKISIHRGTEG